MESLFSPTEQLKIQRVAVPASKAYNKTHFNRAAVQEAFLTETKLNFNKTTLEKNFERSLSF